MIRRSVVGMICLLLALLIGAGGECYLRGSARGLIDAAAVPSDASAQEVFAAAESAVNVWNSRQLLLGVILKHSDADALGKLFAELSSHLEARSAAACAETLLRCRAEVLVLLEGERFSWENILHINGKKFLKMLYF